MRTSNWNTIAHTAKLSKYKLRKKRKKSAKIRVLKEISRRLALGLELPSEAVAYAKGQTPIAPTVKPPRRQRRKRDFYSSNAWRDIRYQAIKRSKGRCEACGRSPQDRVKLHADHIKPRKARTRSWRWTYRTSKSCAKTATSARVTATTPTGENRRPTSGNGGASRGRGSTPGERQPEPLDLIPDPRYSPPETRRYP